MDKSSSLGMSPYPFGHPGLAGEPAALDPAQIWLGPARSGLPFFFFPVFYLFAELSAAIKISLKLF
jgi:hypothetical protein